MRCIFRQRGWGSIDVVEADIDWDEPGEPKTDDRTALPDPERSAAGAVELVSGDPSGVPKVRHPPPRVYDCRHAAATTWLRAGVPPGEVARRLGHSVETLVPTYVEALQGDDSAANKLINSTLAATRKQIVVEAKISSRACPAGSRKLGERASRGRSRARR